MIKNLIILAAALFLQALSFIHFSDGELFLSVMDLLVGDIFICLYVTDFFL